MVGYVTLVVLSLLAAIFSALRSTYSLVSASELKRRSRTGDAVAQLLHQVVRHGQTVDTVLWSGALLSSSLAIFIAAKTLPTLAAITFTFVLLLVVFVLLPGLQQNRFNRWISAKLAPWFAVLLVRLRPISTRVGVLTRKYRSAATNTGLYEKEDLIDLLERQKSSSSNRIDPTELDLLLNSLKFADKKVSDYMIPKRAVHFVSAEEPVGPILLSELHDTGFSRFPVRKEDENTVVGTLYLKDLVKKRTHGIVSNVMSPDVFYVHQDDLLEKTLDAFLKTKHHLFIVVNDFEEIVGIITIEDVLEQILGRKIVDEFDKYDDLRAVAQREATQDHENNREDMV